MNRNSFSIASALLIAFSLSPAHAGVKKVGGSDSREAINMLKDIELSTAAIKDQSDELVAFSMTPELSPESHLDTLNALKDELNKAGREVSQLENGPMPPWERQALAKAAPLLADAAANTQKAIEYFNENKHHLWTQDYQGYAEQIWHDATDARSTLRDYLHFAQTHDREEQIEHRIGMAGN